MQNQFMITIYTITTIFVSGFKTITQKSTKICKNMQKYATS